MRIQKLFLALVLLPLSCLAQGLPDLNSFNNIYYNLVPKGCYGSVSNNYASNNNLNLVVAGSWYDINGTGIPSFSNPSHTYIQTYDFVNGVVNGFTTDHLTNVAGIEKLEISDNGNLVVFMPLTPPGAGFIGLGSTLSFSVNSGATFSSSMFSSSPLFGNSGQYTLQNGVENKRRFRDFVITPDNNFMKFWLVWNAAAGAPAFRFQTIVNNGYGQASSGFALQEFFMYGGSQVYNANIFNVAPNAMYGDYYARPSIEAAVVNNSNKVVVIYSASSSLWQGNGTTPTPTQINETLHYYAVFDVTNSVVYIGRIGRSSGLQTGANINQNLYPARIASDGENVYVAFFKNFTANGSINYEIFRFNPDASSPSGFFPNNAGGTINGVFPIADITDLDLLSGVETGPIMNFGNFVPGTTAQNDFGRLYNFTAPKFPPGAAQSHEVVLSYLTPEDLYNGSPNSNGVIRNAIIDTDNGQITSIVRNDISQSNIAPYNLMIPAKPDASNLFGIKIGNLGYTMSSFCLNAYAGAPTSNPPYGAAVHFVDAYPSQ